ncbi:DUF6177 family protein [Actinoallomurus rhizosphaericola]|uniref:DUF6177 family protein n=1 Tax=Actinoallomurus rhizosphaericola TaxID=2952536 RepID=UPI002091DA00|nr:DUF6177 family protein [Actinoallomurus rhizosphaericola]MCO5993028.1 DUF6177 family protein [Actinoallomurus rhizosphaericola]
MTGPAADALTPSAMVVLQDRPVVGFTKWLADGLRLCSETRRGLQIVTGPDSRITVPLRLVLTSPNSHWVVRADGGYYDGLSGVPLVWDGAGFVTDPQARTYAPAYTTAPSEPVGAQLTVTFRVRYTSDTGIGTATEEICTALTGGPPAGWGTAEPATDVWRRERLSELFWSRGAEATWLTIVGAGATPAVGTLLVSKTGEVVEEAVTIVVGYADPRDVPVAELPGLLGGIAAGRHLISLFTQLGNGRADLTTVPRWLGPPGPIGMAVGGAISEAPGIPAQRIGDARSPAVWYVLGDGRQQEGWQRYEQLTRHLQGGF